MSENQSLDKMISLASWIISVIFFIFVSTPMAIILYISVTLVYAIKQLSQFLKKNHKKCKSQI
jgi:hypothetical protein